MIIFKSNATSIFLSLAFIVTLGACSTEPKVVELSASADPQIELDRVGAGIAQAQTNQVDMLSPKNFEAAKKALNQAVEARATNQEQKKVLHSIAVAQAYLDKANAVAGIASQLLAGPIEARRDALHAKAITFYPKETENADKTFRTLTERIEDGKTSKIEEKRAAIEANYREIELSSLKKLKLGPAQVTMNQAVQEGAEKLTPSTLAWAKHRLAEDETLIETNLRNETEMNKASDDASNSANRLLKMVRDAKGSTQKNPEDLAQQIENNERTTIKSEKDLDQVATDLASSQANLANASAQNKKLESQLWLNKEFEIVRGQFTKTEADVCRDGDKILLRMKGLAFIKNKSEINSSSFPLLAKVQKVLGDFGKSNVAIEGHTDSIGPKQLNADLSLKRAESVQSYLIANNNISATRFSALGFGDSKPIATNKTASGRSQNRRVDIIITADTQQN